MVDFSIFQPEIVQIATKLQTQIMQIFPDAVISEDKDNIGFGYGSGYKDLVFVISPFTAHVNLGIVNNASLDDPDNLMEGKGKVHRHVNLKLIEQVRSPELRELMLRALQAARQ
jgi:hypothetical protein